MTRSLLLSASLHGILLYLAAFGLPGCHVKSNRPQQTSDQEAKPEQNKQHETEIVDILPKPLEKFAKPGPMTEGEMQAQIHNSNDCPVFYGGIGIKSRTLPDDSIRVTDVVPGYPAARAGMKVGDLIITPYDTIRGEVGTEIDIMVIRDGNPLTLPMQRDKVCCTKHEKDMLDQQDRMIRIWNK